MLLRSRRHASRPSRPLGDALRIIGIAIVTAGAASAQLTTGIGPVGQVSAAASTWQASARLSAMARIEMPQASVDLEGSFGRSGAGSGVGSFAARQLLMTPAWHGVRLVGAIELEKSLQPFAGQSAALGTTSLSFHRGEGGAWLGVVAASGIRAGSWRQIGDWLTIAFSSSLRKASVGGRGPRFWTEYWDDSTFTDSGWVATRQPHLFGDSGSVGQRVNWVETEATIGARLGRLALDGAVGWRPAIDTANAADAWFRGTATFAIAQNVAVSAGLGTTSRRLPFSLSTGRYAQLGVRLAPAALLRPREAPEITPAASSFRVERAGGQYIARVRLPRARVVELSGDFNGWQPLRLTQEMDGSWIIGLDLEPGAYRMNLRIDGEQWVPPPGTAAVDDEFNGKVGLVVVR